MAGGLGGRPGPHTDQAEVFMNHGNCHELEQGHPGGREPLPRVQIDPPIRWDEFGAEGPCQSPQLMIKTMIDAKAQGIPRLDDVSNPNEI